MSFENPHLWPLILIGPALAFFYVWALKARDAAVKKFLGETAPEKLVRGAGRVRLKAFLVLTAATLASCAAIGPRWGFQWEEMHSRGVDVLFALDVSKSMLAEDVSPSRLERGKRKILDFLSIAKGDRVGVMGFAGTAFVSCPLTVDYAAVPVFLGGLSPDAISTPGSNIGNAIDTAFKDPEEKDRRGKALVILSDGENLEGDPAAAAKRAKERGIRVFTIGIGKETGAPIPLPEGGFKKDRHGEMVLTKLDEKSLQELALATDGAYLRSVSDDADLQSLYSDIHRGADEKEGTGGRRKREYQRYAWPLAAAILLLILEMGLPDAAKLALLLVVLAPQGARASITDVLAGQKAYHAGDYDKAIEHFLAAQVDDPNNAKLRYDLGSAYYKAGKFAEAERMFGTTAQEKDTELKEKSAYNLGNSAFRQQRFEDAVKAYQEALKQNPKDGDAEHNLKVAQQMMQMQQQQQKNKGKDDKKNEDKKDEKKDQKPDDKQVQKKDEKKKPDQDQARDQGKDKDQDKDKDKDQDKAKDKDKEKDKQPAPGEPKDDGKMSREEAEQWLSRLGEERKDKKKKGTPSYDVEKDW